MHASRLSALVSTIAIADGSFIAFFECADRDFDFKPQHDLLALEVEPAELRSMFIQARIAGVEVRGRSDHGIIDSIYLLDQNSYVVERCAKREGGDTSMDPARNGARAKLDRWSATRALAATRGQ